MIKEQSNKTSNSRWWSYLGQILSHGLDDPSSPDPKTDGNPEAPEEQNPDGCGRFIFGTPRRSGAY